MKTPEPFPPRQTIRRRLAAWYVRDKRDLPWRRRPDDPYAQLLAEVMLQQTQVATVEPYYERFIARFPTVRALAAADPDDVLALWSGLGYYSRARNLHAAAKKIVESFGGRVPSTVQDLLTLPGIGRYTAGAVASVAYGVRAPILDGNVSRVLTRLLAITADPKQPAVRDRLWAEAEAILPAGGCGDFNQAMMDLGATICLPGTPRCPDCPIRSACRAYAQGLTDRIPVSARRTRVLSARMAVAAIGRSDGRLLFVQRPERGLWAGLWELPSEQALDGEAIIETRARLAGRLRNAARLESAAVGEVTRLLTHRRVIFTVFPGRSTVRPRFRQIAGQPVRWVRPDQLSTLAVSRACQAILALLTGRPTQKGGRGRSNDEIPKCLN